MSEPLLYDKLNTETARICWQELQPHFARGATVYVDPALDLLAVAKLMAEDNSQAIGELMRQGAVAVVDVPQAEAFLAVNQEMWALVVAPWVLVQPITEIGSC